MRMIIKNIGLLATPLGSVALKGKEQGEIALVPDTYIVVRDGLIEEVGGTYQTQNWTAADANQMVDAAGALVTPGLVDAHTHLVFAGWRQHELPYRLQGLNYLDMLAAGGGILHTVAYTRKAELAQLVAYGQKSLDIMLAHGTTTCEIKSGYGLTIDDEIKSLLAVRRLQELQMMDLVPTFLGAHAIPPEYKGRSREYVQLVCEQMIPRIAREELAEFCDVFCEAGAFTKAEARYILECGRQYGLQPKIHADEMTDMRGAELAGEIRAMSAEHLIKASEQGLAAMAEAGVIAVLLPGTSFYLGEPFARARAMVDMGIPVVVASDFNPGSCPNESLQLPMNLACLKYRLTPAETLTGVTLNAAAAVKRARLVGTIEPGKQGDLVIWNAPDLNFLFYHWGVNLVRTVIKKGRRVVG